LVNPVNGILENQNTTGTFTEQFWKIKTSPELLRSSFGKSKHRRNFYGAVLENQNITGTFTEQFWKIKTSPELLRSSFGKPEHRRNFYGAVLENQNGLLTVEF
jgi:hypothetical protein